MGSITITAFTPTNNGVDTSFNGPITIELLGAGTLIGTTTINAVNGSATFSGLSINKTGIYEIEATSPNVVPVDTLAFNVLPVGGDAHGYPLPAHFVLAVQFDDLIDRCAPGGPI